MKLFSTSSKVGLSLSATIVYFSSNVAAAAGSYTRQLPVRNLSGHIGLGLTGSSLRPINNSQGNQIGNTSNGNSAVTTFNFLAPSALKPTGKRTAFVDSRNLPISNIRVLDSKQIQNQRHHHVPKLGSGSGSPTILSKSGDNAKSDISKEPIVRRLICAANGQSNSRSSSNSSSRPLGLASSRESTDVPSDSSSDSRSGSAISSRSGSLTAPSRSSSTGTIQCQNPAVTNFRYTQDPSITIKSSHVPPNGTDCAATPVQRVKLNSIAQPKSQIQNQSKFSAQLRCIERATPLSKTTIESDKDNCVSGPTLTSSRVSKIAGATPPTDPVRRSTVVLNSRLINPGVSLTPKSGGSLVAPKQPEPIKTSANVQVSSNRDLNLQLKQKSDDQYSVISKLLSMTVNATPSVPGITNSSRLIVQVEVQEWLKSISELISKRLESASMSLYETRMIHKDSSLNNGGFLDWDSQNAGEVESHCKKTLMMGEIDIQITESPMATSSTTKESIVKDIGEHQSKFCAELQKLSDSEQFRMLLQVQERNHPMLSNINVIDKAIIGLASSKYLTSYILAKFKKGTSTSELIDINDLEMRVFIELEAHREKTLKDLRDFQKLVADNKDIYLTVTDILKSYNIAMTIVKLDLQRQSDLGSYNYYYKYILKILSPFQNPPTIDDDKDPVKTAKEYISGWFVQLFSESNVFNRANPDSNLRLWDDLESIESNCKKILSSRNLLLETDPASIGFDFTRDSVNKFCKGLKEKSKTEDSNLRKEIEFAMIDLVTAKNLTSYILNQQSTSQAYEAAEVINEFNLKFYYELRKRRDSRLEKLERFKVIDNHNCKIATSFVDAMQNLMNLIYERLPVNYQWDVISTGVSNSIRFKWDDPESIESNCKKLLNSETESAGIGFNDYYVNRFCMVLQKKSEIIKENVRLRQEIESAMIDLLTAKNLTSYILYKNQQILDSAKPNTKAVYAKVINKLNYTLYNELRERQKIRVKNLEQFREIDNYNGEITMGFEYAMTHLMTSIYDKLSLAKRARIGVTDFFDGFKCCGGDV